MDNSPIHRQASSVVSEVAILLRHRGLLDRLLRAPGREFTVRELSLESGEPYATTWRTVRDLVALGALRERRVGASRVISLNPTSPLVPDLQRLLSIRLQPHRSAALLFARRASRLPEVGRVVLFGSTVRRGAGPTSDVDVAVVMERRTDAVLDRLFRIAAEVQDATGLRVTPVTVRPEEIRGNSAWSRTLRQGEDLYVRP